ncbi:MAG TPA: hypothetical protein EYH30_05705 [Anaerolineales bacterium]|nr:hypothetical protein [Anaerolineae bacterium]HIQ01609.1 hypothetical protein [Anaerolineales bacterium]
MLNVVVVEGYVTNTMWRWSGDLYFRLASYRDPDLPQKPPPQVQTDHDQTPDYLTVRVIGGAPGGLPVAVRPGQRVRIHGFLGSRPRRRTLAEVAEMAQGAPVIWAQGFDPESAVLRDEVTDVVADRIVALGRAREEEVQGP